MVIRKSEESDLPPVPPIPTRVVSNGEYNPLPKTERQRAVDYHLLEYADRYGKPRGLSRRNFLKTASGMAAVMLAMNSVYGRRFFDVEEVEAADEAAALSKRKGNQFIFDVQTHYLQADVLANAKTPRGKLAAQLLGGLRSMAVPGSGLKDLTHATYVKEIFLDSETTMAIISGVPAEPGFKEAILPVEQMVRTRNEVNAKAGTRRMLSHGLPAPLLGKKNLDDMDRQVKDLKVDAWKLYTADGVGGKGWWLDDPKIAYPVWEKARKLKMPNICVHKGLAAQWFAEKYCRVHDIEQAALDWPDLNFIIYHSGYPYIDDMVAFKWFKPQIQNVYCEIGSAFAATVVGAPVECAHVLGKLLRAYGADHIIWGTDSLWWGSPQWQIEAFRRFQIPEDLQKGWGYKPITDEEKTKIFGLNAAKLFGINVDETMKRLALDDVSTLRRWARQEAGAAS